MFVKGDIQIDSATSASIESRKLRGLEIAAMAKIHKVENVEGYYLVPSVTNPKLKKYKVYVRDGNYNCTCADYETTRFKCKHVYATEFALQRERNDSSEEIAKPIVTDDAVGERVRKNYPVNWPAYNAAQMNEKKEFQKLLADLCKGIVEIGRPSRGRPAVPLSDAIFSIVYKVYSTFSGRRFTSDLCDAQSNGFINRVPHYNSAFRYMENPETFGVLTRLIEQSSLPLRAIESNFAVDSTGFAYSRFVRWYDIKYNRFTSEQQWVKAHLCCGVKTNVVTAVEIHERDANDGPILPSLVNATAKNFTMREVYADKGYSGRECHDAIANVGATPYIAFKGNATGGVGGLFEKMFHYFQFNPRRFFGPLSPTVEHRKHGNDG
jgi:hypothetical protein